MITPLPFYTHQLDWCLWEVCFGCGEFADISGVTDEVVFSLQGVHQMFCLYFGILFTIFSPFESCFFSSRTLSVHHEVLAVYTCTSSMCPSKPSNTKLRCCSLGLGRWPRVLSWPNTTSFSSSSVAHLTQKMLKCHVHLRCEPLEIPFAPLKA